MKMIEIEMNGETKKTFAPEEVGLVNWKLSVLDVLDKIYFAKEKGEETFTAFSIDDNKKTTLLKYGYEIKFTGRKEKIVAKKTGKEYELMVYEYKRV